MFVDDDDDFMDLDPFSDDEETQPPTHISPTDFVVNEDLKEDSLQDDEPKDALRTPKQLLNRKQELDRLSVELDEMAAQLRFALDLAKQLELCSSEANIPIKSKIRARLLDSGSIILLLELLNNSTGVFNGWFVSINWSSLEEPGSGAGINHSRNIFIERLEKGQSYVTEVFVSFQNISLPIYCNVQLMRTFTMEAVTRVIGLDLSDIVVTSLNRLQTVPDDDMIEIRGNFQISLPPAFVYLMLNCDRDENAIKLLQLIRKEFSTDVCTTDSATILTRLQDLSSSSHSSHLIRITVEKDSKYTLTVQAKDPEIRSRINTDFYLYFLIRGSRLLKTSKDYLPSEPNFSNIERLFTSVMARFF